MIKFRFIIICLVIVLFDKSFAQNRFPKVPIKNTELRNYKSSYVNQVFSIDIFMPENYAHSTERYPVVYITDAEYNFGMVSYATDRLIKGKEIQSVILVGIAYDTTFEVQYNFRRRDYTPTHVDNLGIFGLDTLGITGGADKFICFIQKELIPFIDKEYRTIPNDNSIVGMSYGGLFAYYSLFKYPELFKRYIIVSPSIWYDHLCLYCFEEQSFNSGKNPSAIIYTSVGGDEDNVMKRQWKEFSNKIKQRNYKKITIKSEMLDGETHKSIFPRAFTNGMKYIFKNNLKR